MRWPGVGQWLLARRHSATVRYKVGSDIEGADLGSSYAVRFSVSERRRQIPAEEETDSWNPYHYPWSGVVAKFLRCSPWVVAVWWYHVSPVVAESPGPRRPVYLPMSAPGSKGDSLCYVS